MAMASLMLVVSKHILIASQQSFESGLHGLQGTYSKEARPLRWSLGFLIKILNHFPHHFTNHCGRIDTNKALETDRKAGTD